MLNLEIITPDRIAYTDKVDMVSLPSVLGRIGILPHHISLFAQLIEGEVKIKKGSEELYLAIGGGFVQVTQDKVMVLVTRAVHADELNESEINRAKVEAQEALKQKPTGKELLTIQTMLRQSLVDAAILRRRRKHRVN
jgi:F-type H+-transporting ATPase subunit epsilon